MHPRIQLAASLIAIALTPALAHGGILSTTGQVIVVPAPLDARTGHWESSKFIRAFSEQQNITLTQGITANITVPGTSSAGVPNLSTGTIAVGTVISSYFLHFDDIGTPGSPVEAIGSITFGSDVLGIMVLSQSLDNTDGYPGLPTTTYAAADSSRGLELTANPGPGQDSITLSADRRTVSFDLHNVDASDDVRIITAAAVPEPSSLALLGAGSLGLLASLRRRLHVQRLSG